MSGVPIVMYHALSAPGTLGTPVFARLTLAPGLLEAHLGYLSEEGYQAITISELTERRRRGALGQANRLIALTFDDVYADFGDVALPTLLRYGMAATLFVPTCYVGGHSGWMGSTGEGGRAVLSWRELKIISQWGIEIGAHSHTHPELDMLAPQELAEQTALPKVLLEDRLGLPVRSFAYPYGRYDRRVRDAVATAGYSGACTMNMWAATSRDHRLELPRIAVFDDTDLATRLAACRGPVRRAALRARRAAQVRARHWRVRPAGRP
jgi:peptidoglycan/xylan/chitin deacetylase (PgdA/CDA1 family)